MIHMHAAHMHDWHQRQERKANSQCGVSATSQVQRHQWGAALTCRQGAVVKRHSFLWLTPLALAATLSRANTCGNRTANVDRPTNAV